MKIPVWYITLVVSRTVGHILNKYLKSLKVGSKLILGTLLLTGLFSCSLNTLDSEIKRAYVSYGYIKVFAPSKTQTGGQTLIALYTEHPEGMKLLQMRTPATGEAAIFFVPVADYRIAAFEDSNGDFIYQAGEPAQEIGEIQVNSKAQDSEQGYVFYELPAVTLLLDSDYHFDFPVDLSLQSLDKKIERARNNFLKVKTWDDPRFSPESIQQGMWEPLSFEEQIGYGLYLLEPLDLSKQPVLFVHGINGSPTQFRTLVESLGDQYQALLYQYPSGFPLDHSAYILHVGISEFLKRYSISRLPIVAHSMGGLVARGTITSSGEGTAATLSPFISLSTPWLGHEAARLGVEWSPTVAPVWRSMVPNSKYQQRIFSNPIPKTIDHHLFFSFAHKSGGPSKGDDGVVTVKSQLGYQAQTEASTIYGIDDTHNGILTNPCVISWITAALPMISSEGDINRTNGISFGC
jgi:pimeloyl-ACP methyl ester carboxylesterase